MSFFENIEPKNKEEAKVMNSLEPIEPNFDVSQAKMGNMRVYGGKYKFEEGDLTCPCQMQENMRRGEEPRQNVSGVAYFPIGDGYYAWFLGQCRDCDDLKCFLVERKEEHKLTFKEGKNAKT